MKSAYFGLWMLVTLTLAIAVGYSLSDDVQLLGFKPKKAPFAQTLWPSEKMVQFAERVDSIIEVEQQTMAVPTDSTRQSILIFGDSMTLNLAYRLAQYAKQNGHELHAINWDSSNTKIWAESDTLDYYISKFHPTFFFISLGSNELYFKNPYSRLDYVRSILAKIGDKPYVWIGPPNWEKDNGLNDMLAAETRKGSFFRTDRMELKRKKDKIHPTRQASALWVDSIMRWLPSSSHPFLAELPSDSLGKATLNVVFLKAHEK